MENCLRFLCKGESVSGFIDCVLSKTDLDKTFVSIARSSNLVSNLVRLPRMCTNVWSFLPLLSVLSKDYSNH